MKQSRQLTPWLLLSVFACATPVESVKSVESSRCGTDAVWPSRTRYLSTEVLGHKMFYREAGESGKPVIVLLHGYPSSSHTYRELIPLLSGRYHVIAPDNLGSGYSAHPDPAQTTYTFDLLAKHVDALLQQLKIEHYTLYMQDFGAPVGFRIAMAHPDRVDALLVQNGNAYIDGLTPPRQAFFKSAHDDRSAAHTASLSKWVSDKAIRETQYLRDVPGERATFMSPDTWTHDIARLQEDGDRAIQVQLFQDYQTNIDAYPEWHAYLREHQPKTLIVWGERDPAFTADGARAYLADLPGAELHLLDAGHFAAEEQAVEVAKLVTGFMERTFNAECH